MRTHNVDDVYELSPLQRGLLLHSVHDGASDMYLSQQTYTFSGYLDSNVLVAAWNAAAKAHPAMRTSFHWSDLDTPLQVVHSEVPVPVDHHDWSKMAPAQQQNSVAKLQNRDRALGFDLSNPPLQRLNIVRLADDRFTLIWTYHHLLLDGWSIPIFTSAVLGQYQHLAIGAAPPSPAPPYRDYIAWLQRQDPQQTREYWTNLLRDTVPSHLKQLQPWDPRRSTGTVDRRTHPLPADLLPRLRASAANHRVTLSTMIQGAWAAVLSRHSETREVTYGCVSSGRPPELPDVERIVGMFANTLPMRVTVDPQCYVGEWLAALQALHAEMRRYEFTPLADIKRWGGAAGRQLFETNLSVENFTSAFDAAASAEAGFHRDELYDKTNDPVAVTVTPDPLTIDLVLHKERFPSGYADELVAAFAAALHAITDASTVSDLLSSVQHYDSDHLTPELTSNSSIPLQAEPDSAGLTGTSKPIDADRHREVLAVFRDVLERPDIEADTNFFDLGGDSFDAVRVVSRLEGADLGLLATCPTARELAAALAAAGPSKTPTGQGITHVARTGPLPCTYQQEGVWYQHRYDPATTVLHVPTALLLRGPLDVPALKRCLLALITRHESLRTRFVELDGVPHQVIDEPPTELIVEQADLRRAEVPAWVADRHTAPFDLAREGVLRISIARVAAQEHVIMLALHHIAVDGWSSKVLAAELSTLYAAEHGEGATSLPPATIQPADYASWQRSDNAGSIANHIEWWRRQLDTAPTLDLPADRPRPAQPTGAGRVIEDQLDRATTDALHAYVRSQRVSALAVLHAALLVTLERHTGQHDIAIGSLFAGRSSPEIEPVVGCFLSIPVLRVQLGEASDFAELVRRCHASITAANNHLDAPFPRVVEALAPQRLAGRNPLFQVGLTLLPPSVGAGLSLGGISGTFVPVPDDYALWDLSVDASDAADGQMHVSIEYSTDLFDEERVRRLLDHLLRTVRQGLGHPQTPYHTLALEPVARASTPRHKRLGRVTASSATIVPFGIRPRTLDRLLTHALGRSPSDLAVTTTTDQAKRGQLHRAAHAVTTTLRQRGVTRGSVVAIALPPGPAQLATALGAWRVGAAVTLRDPARQHNEVPADVCVTDSHTATTAPDSLTLDWAQLSSRSEFAPAEASAAQLDDTAVLDCTNGQVRRLSHRHLWEQMHAMQRHCHLRANDVALWWTAAAVSPWLRQALLPQVVGATCVVASLEDMLAADQPTDDAAAGVTVLDVTEAQARRLAKSDQSRPLRIITVEAALSANGQATLSDRFPKAAVHRLVEAPAAGFVGCSDLGTAGTIEIVGDRRLTVLDERNRPAFTGVPGTVWADDPAASDADAARIDLRLIGIRRDDGSIEIVGHPERWHRSYGHHYHLDFVADAMNALPGVRDVAIRANGEERPVAYVVLDPDQSVERIEKELPSLLALHLRPRTVVAVPEIALTPSGVVDEELLPTPRLRDQLTKTEQTVAAAASTLVRQRPLRPDDNLFDTGLNSLSSMQLIARLEHETGVSLAPREVLSCPTVAGLARLIDDRQHPIATGAVDAQELS